MKIDQVFAVIVTAINSGLNLMLKSSPGLGKSDVVKQAIASTESDSMICHPVTWDATDPKGLPAVVNGKADWLPYGDLRQMMTAKKPLVVFFDDLGQAVPTVQAAIMQIVLERSINGKRISDNVRFLAATNNRKDGAGVAGLLTPLVNRFTMVDIEPDALTWVKWALANNVPNVLCSFLRFRPELISNFTASRDITAFASPRSITTVGQWLNAGITSVEVWAGAVGMAFAAEFKGFYDTFNALAGLPDKVVLNPRSAPIPDRPDVLYALTGALAYRANEGNFDSIMEYVKRIPSEFGTALAVDATTRHPDLLETEAWNNWAVNNQNVL